MKYIYLILATGGFLLSYGLGVVFVLQHGWNFELFWERTVGNAAAASVVADATIATFIFWVFVYRECMRLGMKRWWAYIAATFVFGLMTPLGVYLYFRERHLDNKQSLAI